MKRIKELLAGTYWKTPAKNGQQAASRKSVRARLMRWYAQYQSGIDLKGNQ